jgi:Tol biopolymer transport system component
MWFLTKARRQALAMAVGGILVAVPHLGAGSIQSASVRNTTLPLPAGGNGDSVAPWISADERFVLFSSSASDLVSGDNGQLGLDVFLRDRNSNTTVLVSVNFSGTGGGNGNSLAGQVSTNGRYAVFQSDASDLLPGDTNGVSDIFVRDLQTGSNLLVSVAADGSWGSGASTDPVMTPDGRFVAFVSAANNLVAGDTNGIADVFVRDLVNGTTRLVSTGTNGVDVSAPVMTPDGRFVAYACTTLGFAAGLASSPTGEVFVCDLVSNVTIWASTNAANIAKSVLNLSSAACYHPAISDDGRYVAFKSGGASAVIIFQYDCSNGTLTTISTNGFPAWPQNDDVSGPEMSPDGRFVVFVATNGSPACLTIQLWDAQPGTNLTVSVATDGSLPTNSISDTPAVSADGHYVVFMSNATNLTGNVVSNGVHIYCRDVQAGTTQLIDINTNGIGSANSVAAIPVMNSNGWYVAFACRDGDLVNGDKHGAFNVIVRNLNSDTTELISQHDPGTNLRTGDGLSFLVPSALSDDGWKIMFTSLADDLAPNDFNGSMDVFVYDTQAGTNALVSIGMDGTSAAGLLSSPVMSLNGRFVVFVSTATNLVANNTNGAADIYLRDLEAGTTALVNVNSNGVKLGTNGASAPVISQDGRYVAFQCKTNNAQSSPGTYWRDVVTGRTILLSSATTRPPTISANGQRVLLFISPYWYVWDAQLLTNIFRLIVPTVTAAVLAPTGDRLMYLYQRGTQLNVYNLAGGTNLFTASGVAPFTNSSPWSTDGRFITFVSSSGLVPNDTNSINDVYLCDLQSGLLTLVSINAAQTGSANGASDWPSISGDGHFVIYRSFATNLVTGNTNPPPNIFVFDRFTGSNTMLTTASLGSSWTLPRNAKPAINGDGSVVAFQSWNPNLAANDVNRGLDVFTETLSPWGAMDSDGDGIPDLWMMHYFGHPTGQAGDLSRAQDDADGDGMSNLQEFLAGTDPTDPASVLHLQIGVQISSSNTVTLNWPAVPGKDYQVQFKDDLNDPAWLEIPGATVIGLKGSVSIPAGPSTRFYRVTAD